MRVAIYARVSTANNGQDPTMQTRVLRAARLGRHR
jgi:predicted site-specific integrase-resolvase